MRTLMVNVMRFSQESYKRYLQRESATVQSRLEELRTSAKIVVPFRQGGVEQGAPPNGGSATPLRNS
jgi:hypothetical protein